MNRSELVEAVVAETELDRKQAESAVKALADIVVRETKAGEKVSVFGFGTFTPTTRAARMGRNPQTNTPVKIAASKGVKFSPASAFKETLNSKKAAAKKTAAKKTTAAKATGKKAAAKSSAKATASKSSAKSAAKKTTAKRTSKAAVPRARATTVAVAKTPARKAPARRSTKR